MRANSVRCCCAVTGNKLESKYPILQGGPVPCHAMSWLHVPCQAIFLHVMQYLCVSCSVMIIPCHAVSVFLNGPCFVLRKYLENMPVLCQEYMLFFGLPLSSQPRLNLLRHEKQAAGGSDWGVFLVRGLSLGCLLNGEPNEAKTLGRGPAYSFDQIRVCTMLLW